jgi:acyl homoserine lactone synthase
MQQGSTVIITIASQSELAPETRSSMHEFRYDTFVRRLGWSLPLIDGVERDQYDNDNSVYFLVRDVSNNITACARMLPTVVPYMLEEVFPGLLGDHPAPHDPAVWELSRFAANLRRSGEGRALSLSQPTLDLLESVLEYGRGHGVKRVALVASIGIERLLLRAGFDVHRFGRPAPTENGLIVALYIEVPAERPSRERLRSV